MTFSKYNIDFLDSKDWVKDFYKLNYNKSSEDKKFNDTSSDLSEDEYLNQIEINNYQMDKDLDKIYGLDKAVDKVIEVMSNNKKILLVTDYDCDGLTSAITLTKYFKEILKYHNTETIANERKYGNGINETLLKNILDIDAMTKVALVITADHGMTNNKEYATMKLHGIETIVTDHHSIPSNYPTAAYSVINMQHDLSKYTTCVSGCNTAFLLCVGIHKKLNKDLKELDILLPYVGLSNVVDQMPLYNLQNRRLIKSGINVHNRRLDNELNMLTDILSMSPIIRHRNMSWDLGPFFNSGNRCNTENTILKGFTDEVEVRKSKLLYAMQENDRRKRSQKSIIEEAVEQVNNSYSDMSKTYGIVATIITPYGIAGPTASKLKDTFNRPTIVFKANADNTLLIGSGRTHFNLDLLKILQDIKNEHPEVVVKAAGHKGACGVEIYSTQLEAFRKLFSDEVGKSIGYEIKPSRKLVLAYIKPEDVNMSLAYKCEKLGPYGNGWEEPLFLTKMKFKNSLALPFGRKCTFYRLNRTTVNMTYYYNSTEITPSNWNEKIKPEEYYWVVFKTTISYYNKRRFLSLVIEDIFKDE